MRACTNISIICDSVSAGGGGARLPNPLDGDMAREDVLNVTA